MSKIDDLIKQYCPDGVEFKQLNDIGSLYNGLTGKSKADFNSGNEKYIPYKNVFKNISINTKELELVKITEGERQNKVEIGDVLFTSSSENTEECGMSSILIEKNSGNIYLNSFCFGFRLNDRKIFLPDFMKYLFRSIEIRKQIIKTANGVTRFNISKKSFATIKIPIPPLAVQEEIVRILDTFTQLEAELEAELEARQQQYRYYRDQLLSFGEGVEWTALGKIAIIKHGKDYKKLNSGNIPVYGSGGVMTFVDKYSYNKPTVLIPRKGTITNLFYLETPFWNVDTIYYTKIDTTQIIPKFFYYFMKTIDLLSLDTGSGRPSLTMEILNKIKIPVPPLAEQQRIVAILDKFDALVNDIASGLPAEINARRQQYEYYRNKLLTFKPHKDC